MNVTTLEANDSSDANANSALTTLRLQPEQIAALTPETRDRLLTYMHAWGEPAEQLFLIDALREAHGPLLFLLDHQATALMRNEQYAQALDSIERRQRRSTTIRSQAMEAIALFHMGHLDHARTVADDISTAYRMNATAVCAAAEIYTRLDNFARAQSLLEEFLDTRPRNLEVVLAFIRLALLADQPAIADQYVQRLGTGVPPDISDTQLQELAKLLRDLDNMQSAQAVELEIERRRQMAANDLQQALAPFADQDQAMIADPALFYRLLSGPESIHVDRKEARAIKLEAIRHFGFMELREGQVETIATVLRQESILAVMPTGAGKSLCYQLPALVQEKPTLVISPLIALMKDQVESLPTAARRQATFINSTLSEEELNRRIDGIARGDYKLIYAAPERLRQRSFLRALRNAELDLFVVDEAHCVSLWGHDFRPDYLFLQEARRELGNPPALAMTATAPPRVRDEIVDYITNDSTNGDVDGDAGNHSSTKQTPNESSGKTTSRPHVMTLDIFRNNLHLSGIQFHNEEEKLAALLKFVAETEGSGIVYVNSRHKSESLAFQLQAIGVSAEAYHAGRNDRGEIQDRFMSDKTRVVVATIAFGMGIDKHDIRFIVHFHPSRSLAAYYQEVGRAGRDGKPSQGLLFYSNNDWANLRRWAKADEHTVDFLEKVYAAAATQLGVQMDSKHQGDAEVAVPAIIQTVIGPVDVRRMQQVLNADETTVRVIISMLERVDLLGRSFDVPREISIKLPKKLPPAAKEDSEFTYLLEGLALKPGQAATFNTQDVADFMGWSLDIAETNLLDWDTAGYLRLTTSRRAMLIELPPPPAEMRERLDRMLNQSAAVAQRRIDDIVGYATTERCRHGYISAHFGSPPRTTCEVCDNCTGIRPDLPEPAADTPTLPDDADIEPMIIDCLVSLPKPVGRSGLARILAGSLRAPVTPNKARHHGSLKAAGEATIINYIDDLLESNRLRQFERQGYPVLAATLRGRTEAASWLEEHPELANYSDQPEIEENKADSVAQDAAEEVVQEGDKYTKLQKAIWSWRRRNAAEQGQPPYMIMSNELILLIAENRPQSLAELALLPGMGAQRLEHYGPTILDIIHLNPPQAGDQELLAAQRNAPPPEGATSPAASTQPDRPSHPGSTQNSVTPRIEKRVYTKMQEIRQKKAIQDRMKFHFVAANSLLRAIARKAPQTIEELEAIPGFKTSHLRELAPTIIANIREIRGQSSA